MLTIQCTHKVIITVVFKKQTKLNQNNKKHYCAASLFAQTPLFSLLKYLQGHFPFNIFSGMLPKKWCRTQWVLTADATEFDEDVRQGK